jgi:hypothetical protein
MRSFIICILHWRNYPGDPIKENEVEGTRTCIEQFFETSTLIIFPTHNVLRVKSVSRRGYTLGVGLLGASVFRFLGFDAPLTSTIFLVANVG